MRSRNPGPEQTSRERTHQTVIAADATNPDGATTSVACLEEKPRHFTCGTSPIEAIGAFVVLHHDLVGVEYVEVGLGAELPMIAEDGKTTIGVVKVADGYQGFIASKTIGQIYCADAPVNGKLSWVVVSTEPTACRAAGVVLRRYGWAIDVLVESLSDKTCEPAIEAKPSEPTAGAQPQTVADDSGSGCCCSGDCAI